MKDTEGREDDALSAAYRASISLGIGPMIDTREFHTPDDRALMAAALDWSMKVSAATQDADVLNRAIASNLKLLRGKAGFSLQAVADKAGLSKTHVWDIERGAGNPTVSTLCALAKALSVPASLLLFPSVPANPKDHPE